MINGEKAHHIMHVDINQSSMSRPGRVVVLVLTLGYTPPHFSSFPGLLFLPIYLSVACAYGVPIVIYIHIYIFRSFKVFDI